MSRFKIYLEDDGVTDILRYNSKLEALENEIMEQKLSEIKAQFLINFGVEGDFIIKAIQTRPGKTYGRLSYRICAASARTTAILKRNERWLSQFL